MLLAVAKPAPAQPVPGTPPLDLARLMAALAAVPERRATFREEKHLAALEAPLSATGRLHYRRPDWLEKVTLSPAPETLLIDGARVVLTLGQDPPRVIPLDADPGLHALVDAIRAPLAGDLAALQRGFRVEAGGTQADWTLTLIPRDPGIAGLLQRAVIAGRGDQPRRIEISQAGGDKQILWIEPLS